MQLEVPLHTVAAPSTTSQAGGVKVLGQAKGCGLARRGGGVLPWHHWAGPERWPWALARAQGPSQLDLAAVRKVVG
eukprot:7416249-Alexandrium_andersonii.AAC.1